MSCGLVAAFCPMEAIGLPVEGLIAKGPVLAGTECGALGVPRTEAA